jgi:hypothetical protein
LPLYFKIGPKPPIESNAGHNYYESASEKAAKLGLQLHALMSAIGGKADIVS